MMYRCVDIPISKKYSNKNFEKLNLIKLILVCYFFFKKI